MRFPIPLIFALAVVVGSVVVVVIQLNVVVVGSWDERYSTFNGTHVYQTRSLPSLPYRIIYMGHGTAYFRNPVNVYYLEKVIDDSTGHYTDLGLYLPVRVIPDPYYPSGAYIPWTNPVTGTTYYIYLDNFFPFAYIIGTYVKSSGQTVAFAIPMRMGSGGGVPGVRLRPALYTDIDTTDSCNVLRNSGISASEYHLILVLENRYVDCASRTTHPLRVKWTRVASSVTTAELYPSPPYYIQTLTHGSRRAMLVLSYWYAVDSETGYFAVKVG